MGKTLLEVQLEEIDEATENLRNSVSNHGAPDYSTYTEMCGQIRGLRNARNILTDLAERIDDDE